MCKLLSTASRTAIAIGTRSSEQVPIAMALFYNSNRAGAFSGQPQTARGCWGPWVAREMNQPSAKTNLWESQELAQPPVAIFFEVRRRAEASCAPLHSAAYVGKAAVFRRL